MNPRERIAALLAESEAIRVKSAPAPEEVARILVIPAEIEALVIQAKALDAIDASKAWAAQPGRKATGRSCRRSMIRSPASAL